MSVYQCERLARESAEEREARLRACILLTCVAKVDMKPENVV